MIFFAIGTQLSDNKQKDARAGILLGYVSIVIAVCNYKEKWRLL